MIQGKWPYLAYLELTNPRIVSLVVFTAGIGFILAGLPTGQAGRLGAPLLRLLLGTWLTAAGTTALNQYLERHRDERMERTRNRPLPAKRLRPSQALVFGSGLAFGGVLLLGVGVNILTGLLVVLALSIYLFLYTPMKTRTPLCTLVGAVSGALPPVMGWTAARGTLSAPAAVLFLILFLWQLPHFLAIGWIYEKDYDQAAFRLLPVLDPGGRMTAGMVALYSAALLPASLLPAGMGLAGVPYFWGALLSGTAFLFFAMSAARARSASGARRLLKASIVYLPVLLSWLVLNKSLSQKLLPP